MIKFLRMALVASILIFWATAAPAIEAVSCKKVRMSDVGWADITATTSMSSVILELLGYETSITQMSVPVTFVSIKKGFIDVFLGNWMPSMANDIKPYQEEGSIETVGMNLTGAKYSLATDQALYDAGLHDIKDIAQFKEQLGGTIYGIESGNEGNRQILSVINDPRFNLKGWELVESSEAGMLAQISKNLKENKHILFLGWAPHPMNIHFKIAYLTGFGNNYGNASVFTIARRGYIKECPNIGKFLSNLKFSVGMENQLMNEIIDKGVNPKTAAIDWLKKNPDTLKTWLNGVTTFDGSRTAFDAVESNFSEERFSNKDKLTNFLTANKIPIGLWGQQFVTLMITKFAFFFASISYWLTFLLDGLISLFLWFPPPVLVAGIALLGWYLQKSWKLVFIIVFGLLFIINQRLWKETVETLVLVVSATTASMIIGVPLGIIAAHNKRFYALLRPLLDLMQTMPTFVYLIPVLLLFGLGVAPSLIVTVIFAAPAPIRLTHLGMTSVPKALLEAGVAFGATKHQLLWKVELPAALPTIIVGLTQCIMLSLSMVVMAALIGASGLGKPVVRSLNSLNTPLGIESGLAIVIIAIILDRMCRISTGEKS